MVFGAKDERLNNAAVLKQFLERDLRSSCQDEQGTRTLSRALGLGDGFSDRVAQDFRSRIFTQATDGSCRLHAS